MLVRLWLGLACGEAALLSQSALPYGPNFVINPGSGGPGGKPSIASDGTNFFLVWRDDRSFATNGWDIYGARISRDGVVLDPGGIPISTIANPDPNPGNQYVPSVAFDGANYLVVWTANKNPSTVDYEVYAARVSPNGTVLDQAELQITTGADPIRVQAIACDGTNCLMRGAARGTTSTAPESQRRESIWTIRRVS